MTTTSALKYDPNAHFEVETTEVEYRRAGDKAWLVRIHRPRLSLDLSRPRPPKDPDKEGVCPLCVEPGAVVLIRHRGSDGRFQLFRRDLWRIRLVDARLGLYDLP